MYIRVTCIYMRYVLVYIFCPSLSASPCYLAPRPLEPEAAHHCQHPIKRKNYGLPFRYSDNLSVIKAVCTGKAGNQ